MESINDSVLKLVLAENREYPLSETGSPGH